MIAQASLRGFLENYSKTNEPDVTVIDEVDVNFEPTAYYRALEAKNPLIWFRKVSKFDGFEFVTNVLGSYERMAFALGCPAEQLYDRWNEVTSYAGQVSVSNARNAPVKQQISSGDEVDLSSIPIPVHYLSDGSDAGFGRYVTSGLVVARDPANHDILNLSFTRMQIIGRNRYAFDMGSEGHFSTYVERARKLGARLPISVIIGAHPLYYMLAAAFVENEYAKAAKILEEEYVYGVTNEDLPIPADSEMVIEAEVDLEGHFNEGPFAEFTGYTVSGTTGNVATVKAILRKQRPIYYDIPPSNSREHVSLFTMPRNMAITKTIREFMPPGIEYSMRWPENAAHFLALCSIDKPIPGLAKQVGLALLGLDPLFSRIAVVNEGPADLNLEGLLANLAIQGARKGVNVDIIPSVYSIKLDSILMPNIPIGKMILVTKNPGGPARYSKIVEGKHRVRLAIEGSASDVVFSHQPVDGAAVNVVFDDDIDLTNPTEITWAFGTRVIPDKDVSFGADGSGIVILASKKGLRIPTIPEAVTQRVERKLQSVRQG